MPDIIFGIDGINCKAPVMHEFCVCKQCGVSRDDSMDEPHCLHCTTRDTIANEFVDQKCSIQDLADIVIRSMHQTGL